MHTIKYLDSVAIWTSHPSDFMLALSTPPQYNRLSASIKFDAPALSDPGDGRCVFGIVMSNSKQNAHWRQLEVKNDPLIRWPITLALSAACIALPFAANAQSEPADASLPCQTEDPAVTSFMAGVVHDLLDPDSNFTHQSIMGAPELATLQEGEKYRQKNDWAYVCKYKDANAALSGKSAPKVVFMGDSITEFWTVGDIDLFSDGVIGRGISGQTSTQMVARFWQDVVALHPTAVHIMAGTNDLAENTGYVRDEDYKNNIRAMAAMAQSQGIVVILASIPPAKSFGWRADIKPAERIVSLNQWLKDYADEIGGVYVDYYADLVGNEGELQAGYTHDGVHPQRLGYAAMHHNAVAAIEKAVAKAEN